MTPGTSLAASLSELNTIEIARKELVGSQSTQQIRTTNSLSCSDHLGLC